MAGRFQDRATRPERGPRDLVKWKLEQLAARSSRPRERFTTPRRAPDLELARSRDASLLWLGHASFAFTLGGAHVLVDPIFSDAIGPVRRLTPPGATLAQLPPVDVVCITHNHRDHLDPASLEAVCDAARAARREPPVFVAPLGHRALLESVGARDVRELDWWRATAVGGLEITCVPAKHWSMRWPWDRNDMLWGGFVFRAPEGVAYHSGDTGYGDHFAEIGSRQGPIDWAMLPVGAYEPRWFMKPQHMGPDEAVVAARELRARVLVAMHWGTFELTDEPLGDPPRLAREAFAASPPGPDAELWVLDVGETRRLAGVRRA